MTRIVIVGAGAAGLMASITAAEKGAGEVVLVDTARKPGAKILISGGGRCNVTNESVAESDYWGGPRTFVRRILRRFPAQAARRFFEDSGVPLRAEPLGKLFPVSNRAKDVLDALLVRAARAGVTLVPGVRVREVVPIERRFRIRTDHEPLLADRLVLATGGLSLPKTGSDGWGMDTAGALGHRIVPTTPALVPLLLGGAFHEALAGISHPAQLRLRRGKRLAEKISGSLLWTHFGVSGPAPLDLSRHVARAALDQEGTRVELNLFPELDFEAVENKLLEEGRPHPNRTVVRLLRQWFPERLAAAVAELAEVDAGTKWSALGREPRRRLVRALTEQELPVIGDRGYGFAEATAGGVDLAEVDAGTLESRIWPGLFFAGEILDVDGRLGGFNFQWAWSSGFVAGSALVDGTRLNSPGEPG